MESLTLSTVSSVRTIMSIVQDILAAVETASQNKSRCKKIAERVRCLKDILEAPAPAATRRPLHRLKKALKKALQVVRRCQRSSSSSSFIFFASGRMADSLDGVEKEIDQCILDLTLAYSLGIHQQLAAAASKEAGSGEKDGENKRKKKASAESVVVPGKMMNHEENTTATAAIGVPICTVTAAVPPPPSYGCYGYCWSCRSYHQSYCYYYWRNHGCAACYCYCRGGGDDGGRPSSNAAFCYHTVYSRYPSSSMFSDDDPTSCSIM